MIAHKRNLQMQTTRIRHMTAAMAVTLMTAMSTEPVAVAENAPHVNRGYAPVNGLKMYYEIHAGLASWRRIDHRYHV